MGIHVEMTAVETPGERVGAVPAGTETEGSAASAATTRPLTSAPSSALGAATPSTLLIQQTLHTPPPPVLPPSCPQLGDWRGGGAVRRGCCHDLGGPTVLHRPPRHRAAAQPGRGDARENGAPCAACAAGTTAAAAAAAAAAAGCAPQGRPALRGRLPWRCRRCPLLICP